MSEALVFLFAALIGLTLYFDMLERKRLQQHSDDLIEAAPDAMVVVDREGIIVKANAACERLLGYERAELLGRHIEVLVPRDLRSFHEHHRDRYQQAPRPRPMGKDLQKLEALRVDGNRIEVEISLSPTRDNKFTIAAIRSKHRRDGNDR